MMHTPYNYDPWDSNSFRQQMKLKKIKDKDKEKEKRKKEKLKEMLLLLGLNNKQGGSEESESEEEVEKSKVSKKSTGRKSTKKAVDKALAEEREKYQEEERKKTAIDRKKKIKKQLISLLWLRLYPVMYYVDFYERKGVLRETTQSTILERITTNFDNTRNWIAKSSSKAFDMVIGNAKLNITIVPAAGKKPSNKELESRPAEIQKILKPMIDSLINNTREDLTPGQILEFLGDISQDYRYPPQDFLFAFEVSRLNFTHNAGYKDTTLPKTQMICAFFVLVRVLIGDMLLQPKKVFPTANVNDSMMRNLKTLASILLIVVVDYLRSRVVQQPQNQAHLDNELKVRSRSGPIPFNSPMDLKDLIDNGEEGGGQGTKREEEVFVSNLYNKEQLSAYFQKKQLVDELKSLVEGWCNSIAEILASQQEERRETILKKVKDRQK